MRKIKSFGVLVFTLVSFMSFAQKTKNVKIEIKPYLVACSEQALTPTCLQAKVSGTNGWQPLNNAIAGFEYEKGYNYKLKAVRTETSPGTYTYELKKLISKKQAPLMNVYNKKLILTKLNGQNVSVSGVYATVDPTNQTIYGKSGCNNFNVSYTTDKKGILSVYSSMGTLMACEDAKMKLEFEFLSAFQNQKFKVTEANNVVTFTNVATKQTIEFKIETAKDVWSFINGKEWKLIQLDNVGKDYGNAYIQFDVAEKRISGNAGCNRIFGGFETEGNQISFSQVGATRMMCSDGDAMQTESKVLAYLNAPGLSFDVADQTLNFYLNNKLVMMFAK
ncbi:META domain-containing protein [Flavobacterium agricola]|uniref:META domain-containing protein n=1 Tax=Flavobacterium agricola TaxID=2870839 RepID=A0ABY6LZI3_9FLAO|nr:META domain-containing protein [Flavobacterium agricola]UYW00972.1 META domain-containing protein [Flavobacterium agricola]